MKTIKNSFSEKKIFKNKDLIKSRKEENKILHEIIFNSKEKHDKVYEGNKEKSSEYEFGENLGNNPTKREIKEKFENDQEIKNFFGRNFSKNDILQGDKETVQKNNESQKQKNKDDEVKTKNDYLNKFVERDCQETQRRDLYEAISMNVQEENQKSDRTENSKMIHNIKENLEEKGEDLNIVKNNAIKRESSGIRELSDEKKTATEEETKQTNIVPICMNDKTNDLPRESANNIKNDNKYKLTSEYNSDFSKDHSKLPTTELKGYKIIQEKILKVNSLINQKLLEYSKKIIEDYFNFNIEREKAPFNLERKISPLKQKTLDGTMIKEYILRDEVGERKFREISNNKGKYGYEFTLYHLKYKGLGEFRELPYIGYTKNIKKRYRNHLMNAIGPHGKGYNYVNIVPLHQAIINTLNLRENLKAIKEEIYRLNPRAEVLLQDMDDLYNWLSINQKIPYRDEVMEFIINEIFLQYFDSKEIELHKNRNTLKKKESFLTKSFIHYINGKRVVGTVYPNGLNATIGGSGGKFIHVPLIDVAALCTLGYNIENMSKIMSDAYNKNINPNIISLRICTKEFDDFEGFQETLLKPVVENLIKEDFTQKEISSSLNIPQRTFDRYIKKWYNVTYSFLKLLVHQKRLDWRKIDNYKNDFKKELKGFPLNKWKTWAIKEISTETIGKKIGICSKTVQELYKKNSLQLTGKSGLGLRDIRRFLRKEKAIKLLSKGILPDDIVDKVFKMSSDNTSRIFTDIFDMPYKEILETYYLIDE